MNRDLIFGDLTTVIALLTRHTHEETHEGDLAYAQRCITRALDPLIEAQNALDPKWVAPKNKADEF